MKRLLSLALIGLPLLAAARPADPEPFTVKNVDGSLQTIVAHGDENFSFFADVNSGVVMERAAQGLWKSAVRNGRVLKFNSQDINLLKAESVPYQFNKQEANQTRMALLDRDGRTTYPTVSTEPIHALVILAEFPDTPYTVPDPQKLFDRMLNEEGFSEYGAKGSAHDYFHDSSNGLFNVHFDVSRVVRLEKNHTYYNGNDEFPDGSHRNYNIDALIRECVLDLDDEIDFSQYDLDGDGNIDNIFFFYSGYGQADSHDITTLWPHQGDYYNHVTQRGKPRVRVDGVEMRTYACSNELNYKKPEGEDFWLDGIGAFCHEYGHVLGLPDLYDVYYSGCKTPGKYSIMDQGSYNENSTLPPAYSAYERWICHWLEFENPEAGSTCKIGSISDNSANIAVQINIPRLGSSAVYPEYFIFETRHASGWDASLNEEGMFIWRVNFSRSSNWVNNTVNTGSGAPNVEMYASSGKKFAWPGEDNITYVYPGCSNELKFASNNAYFGMWITGINYDADTHEATFEYNKITECPEIATVLHENIEFDTDGVRGFTLSWDDVPEADSYLLTVIRRDANGRERYVDGLEEYNVGKVTSRHVTNITANQWQQDFTAYVRCFKDVPAGPVSNELHFVPANGSSAVDGIEEENAPVYGGVGCIVAPDNAVVYSVSGAVVDKNNLSSGIYIVRIGNKSVKVSVK